MFQKKTYLNYTHDKLGQKANAFQLHQTNLVVQSHKFSEKFFIMTFHHNQLHISEINTLMACSILMSVS